MMTGTMIDRTIVATTTAAKLGDSVAFLKRRSADRRFLFVSERTRSAAGVPAAYASIVSATQQSLE